MFCLPFRVLSPRPALKTVAASSEQVGSANNNTESRRFEWARTRRTRRVLHRRSQANCSSIKTCSTAPSASKSAGSRTGVGRRFVLAWKRLNKSLQPRQSQRFSYVPEGFVLVMKGPDVTK
ncbi:hypothetical protein L218DRAFT_941898 [Marasmius fiardii PR-910]|nr:hypothetical protein L218DRAFT_941898 [Marasmius fiardii PR-910]